MIETAVLGVIGMGRGGSIRRCVECQAELPADAPPCTGFGAGCVIAQRREPEPTPPRPAGG